MSITIKTCYNCGRILQGSIDSEKRSRVCLVNVGSVRKKERGRVGKMREMDNKLHIWDVLRLIAENKKRRAKCEGGIIALIDGKIKWEHSENVFEVVYGMTGKWNVLTDKEWEIIEPPKKLKEMFLSEALYYKSITEKEYTDIISCITGEDFSRFDSQISKEEYMGLWTIRGVYEDD